MALSLAQFRELALARLNEAEVRFRQSFPSSNMEVGAGKGFPLCLSALVPDAPLESPDNVALSITLVAEIKRDHLLGGNYLIGAKSDTEAKFIDADVCWGHPSGRVEGSFASEPVAIDDANLQKIYDDLPRLIGILESALKRGAPLP